jgi:hypothetical protein
MLKNNSSKIYVKIYVIVTLDSGIMFESMDVANLIILGVRCQKLSGSTPSGDAHQAHLIGLAAPELIVLGLHTQLGPARLC